MENGRKGGADGERAFAGSTEPFLPPLHTLRGDRRAVGVPAAVIAWAFVALVFLANWYAAAHFGGLVALVRPLPLLLDFFAVVLAVAVSLLSVPRRPGPIYREWGREPR